MHVTPVHALVAFLAMVVVGEPLFVIIAGLALLCFVFLDPSNPHAVLEKMTQVILSFATLAEQDPLIAIPLFTLAGTIMTHGGISARLVAVARALTRSIPGGLGMACVGACTLFAAISGSSAVTIIAIGGLIYPALRKENFTERFSLGLITSCGAIGILIPPSLPLIVYGVVASNSVADGKLKPQIDDLFRAGLIPSLLSVIALCVYCFAVATWQKIPAERFSLRELGVTLRRGAFALLLIVILLGGIYAGITTATEASAVACVYALVVEVFIHREIGAKDLLKIGTETITLVGVILMVLVSALALTNFLEIQKIPDAATDRMQWSQVTVKADLFGEGSPARIIGEAREEGADLLVDVKDPADWDDFLAKGSKTLRVPKAAVIERSDPLVSTKLGFLVMVNILLLVVGSVMDIYSGIVVIAPLIVPMAVAYHVNLVHLGIIFVLNLELGLAHPPLGINLFIAQSYFRKSILEVTLAAIPFLVLLLGVLAAVTYWEPLSLWLVHQAAHR